MSTFIPFTVGDRVVVRDTESKWHGCHGTVIYSIRGGSPWTWVTVRLALVQRNFNFCGTQLVYTEAMPSAPDATGDSTPTEAPGFTVNAGGGKKHTGGKPSSNQVPPAFIYELSAHMTKGAVKYGFGNWCKGLTESQALESIRRHSDKRRAGENSDPETGSSHYIAIAANAMMAWCLESVGNLTDDRNEVFIETQLKGSVK